MAAKKRSSNVQSLSPMPAFQGGMVADLITQLSAHYGDRSAFYLMPLTKEQYQKKAPLREQLQHCERGLKSLLEEKGGTEKCRCTVDWQEASSINRPYKRTVWVWY